MTDLVAIARRWFADNQFASGGAVLAGAGILIAALRRVPGAIVDAVKRRIIITAEVNSQDPAFGDLAAWLARHTYAPRARRWLVITVKTSSGGDIPAPVGAEPVARERSRREPERLFVPAPGQHIFRHRGRWLWVSYGREQMMQDKLLLGFHETITLRAFGRGTDYFDGILAEAYRLSVPEAERAVAIYTALWSSWQRLAWQEARPLESLVFDDDLGARLVGDIREFQGARERYRKLGVPWRRGYLLHGEPGNGKSSLIAAVAGELGFDLYVVNVSGSVNDDHFRSLLLAVPRDAAVVLEDIDGALRERGEAKHPSDELTRSGLLNALDGLVSGEGRIVFMTTNQHTGLDPALIRPGRADVQLYLGNASRTQARRLFERFYPGADGLAARFAAGIEPGTVSMAALQAHFLERRDAPERAAAEVALLRSQSYAGQAGELTAGGDQQMMASGAAP